MNTVTNKQQVGEVQDEREQFEAWARKLGHDLTRRSIGREGDDSYIDDFALYAWTAWQAALAARQPVGQELKEALAKCISHGKDLVVRLDAVTNDRDEMSVRYFGELTAIRRDRDNWRERAEISDKKQPSQDVDLSKLERFDIEGVHTSWGPDTGKTFCADGEYVYFEDVLALLGNSNSVEVK